MRMHDNGPDECVKDRRIEEAARARYGIQRRPVVTIDGAPDGSKKQDLSAVREGKGISMPHKGGSGRAVWEWEE